MKTLFLVLSFLFSFSVLAETDPKAAFAMAKEGKAVLVDVREGPELKSGMIEGAEWFPMSKLESESNWKTQFTAIAKDRVVFLYCRSGNRSGKVRTILKSNGIDSENLGGFETLKEILPVTQPTK